MKLKSTVYYIDIAEINIDIDESKKILEAKYGTVSIDLETGVITELPDEEDKKD